MDKEKDYFTEDIIESTNELLDSIQLGGIELEGLPEAGNKIENEIQNKEFEELGLEEKPASDGTVELAVSKDDMKVIADFYPPSGSGSDIDKEMVKDRLEYYGVVFGVEWDAVNEAISRCNDERVQVNGVVIAGGQQPVEEVPEKFVVEDRLQKKQGVLNDEGSRIDFKERTTYTLVKKDETVARVVPKREGRLGKTVKGELIPYKRASDIQKKPGRNTVLAGDKVVAAADGRFEVRDDHFWVHEVFEVQGDVDYHTGNISFPGDIIIHGRVNDGFKVEAGGSIICKGTLDASEIKCKRDLQVYRGVIGRQKGKISVGGTINTKYIENSYVEAEDTIFVETGILHSIVRTRNRLEMAKKSIVAGGKIYSQNGVIAGQVGTKMGVKTEIRCGIDHRIQRNLEWIKDKNVLLASKLSLVEGRIKADSVAGKDLVKTRDRLRQYIHKLNRAAKALMVQLDRNRKADVVVTGTVFPGVYIEICRLPYVVSHEIEGVRFYLDSEKGAVEVEPLM
jgi:uncharacterized protein (DUF342 family)